MFRQEKHFRRLIPEERNTRTRFPPLVCVIQLFIPISGDRVRFPTSLLIRRFLCAPLQFISAQPRRRRRGRGICKKSSCRCSCPSEADHHDSGCLISRTEKSRDVSQRKPDPPLAPHHLPGGVCHPGRILPQLRHAPGRGRGDAGPLGSRSRLACAQRGECKSPGTSCFIVSPEDLIARRCFGSTLFHSKSRSPPSLVHSLTESPAASPRALNRRGWAVH